MTPSDMDRRILAEKRLACRTLACRAAQYFYQGDLPQAQSFFAVLREVAMEVRELEATTERHRSRFAQLLNPRKPWFERP